MSYSTSYPRRNRLSGWKIRLMIAGIVLLFSVIKFTGSSSRNLITGERQHVGNMTTEQEVRLGMRAAPQMVQQYGGLSYDERARAEVSTVGQRMVEQLRRNLQRQDRKLPYPFDFHLLADGRVVNAFALPGGQIFITEALFRRLGDSPREREGLLAGVLGHEIGHVIARHGAEQMAKNSLIQGIVGAAGVAGGDVSSAQLAQMIGGVINMKYSRSAELEADEWGVQLMMITGYNPNHLITVMDILEQSSGDGPPEFLSTHPAPANRKQKIEQIIEEKFPGELPAGLR